MIEKKKPTYCTSENKYIEFQNFPLVKISYTSIFRLHEKHPWYSEQLTFLLVNTDNNAYLTKDEFFEAAKVSPDMQALNFSYKQLENLVDGLIAIGDQVSLDLTKFCYQLN